jgi:hypothetical protein
LTARPDFTGTWKLNLERSTLRGSIPKQLLMKIEHREPILIQEVWFTDDSGSERRQTFTVEIGSGTFNPIGGTTALTHSRWEGSELVIESRMKTPEREFYFKDHWSLSGDGQTLTMAHRDDDLAGQISVLEKADRGGCDPNDFSGVTPRTDIPT